MKIDYTINPLTIVKRFDIENGDGLRLEGYAKNSQKTTDFSQWMNGIAWLFLHPKNGYFRNRLFSNPVF